MRDALVDEEFEEGGAAVACGHVGFGKVKSLAGGMLTCLDPGT
jgi:hypothetical protein